MAWRRPAMRRPDMASPSPRLKTASSLTAGSSKAADNAAARVPRRGSQYCPGAWARSSAVSGSAMARSSATISCAAHRRPGIDLAPRSQPRLFAVAFPEGADKVLVLFQCQRRQTRRRWPAAHRTRRCQRRPGSAGRRQRRDQSRRPAAGQMRELSLHSPARQRSACMLQAQRARPHS